MSRNQFPDFQTSFSEETIPGFWKLAPGRTLSLQPHQAGVLRVAQGQLWVTLDAEPQGAGNELGDYFLCAGEQLTVKPGQHVVLESIEQAEQPTAFFEWSAVSAIASAAYNSPAVAVTRPLKDLGQALGMAGTAVVRLLAGIASYGRQLVLGRLATTAHASH